MDERKVIEKGIDSIISMVRNKASAIGDSNFSYITKNIVGSPYYKVYSRGNKKCARVYVPTAGGNLPYLDLRFAICSYTRKPVKPTLVGYRGTTIYSWINLEDVYIMVYISTNCASREEDVNVEEESVVDMLQKRIEHIEELGSRVHKQDDNKEPCKGDACSAMQAIDAVCAAMAPVKAVTPMDNLIAAIKKQFPNSDLSIYNYDEETNVLSAKESDNSFNEFYLLQNKALIRQSRLTSGTIIAKDAFYNGKHLDVFSKSDVSALKIINGELYIVEVDFGVNIIQYRVPNDIKLIRAPYIVKWKELTEDEIHEIHAYLNGDGSDTWIENIFYSNELTEEMKFN